MAVVKKLLGSVSLASLLALADVLGTPAAPPPPPLLILATATERLGHLPGDAHARLTAGAPLLADMARPTSHKDAEER